MGKRNIVVIALPALAFAVVCGVDILRETDAWDPVEVGLDVAETAMLVLLIIAVAWSVQRISSVDEEQRAIQDYFTRRTARGETWRAERAAEIAAMGDAITREFKAWGLTSAEMDVAGLLLKGASMKEIAIARETSEATIRQQAQSMYRKSGLSGRVELSAYFLDSLLGEAEKLGNAKLSVVVSE
ncbi:regulatory protein, luxR family [Cognatiyoonia koreensis]|uniref:Regulatory protein, luxR family n=1 Tax=Cognatiyoonia koreensis TaxID=364200 RepID=A0A1I0QPX1_9RHOB|nr:LuxR C-terminal-related transcriptional regulator [Cognatiyoonia koreensis]SEW29266.1 regulatory protein, luxR family [Cognatiyoonia koreensis]